MLTLQLRELEKESLVKRTVYAEVPPRVVYELTAIARELIPIWKQLDEWGGKHREMMQAQETTEA
jgi:DNA-binding HxlR family transcriptional regulator